MRSPAAYGTIARRRLLRSRRRGHSCANRSFVFSVRPVVTYGGGFLGFVVDRYRVRPLYAAGAALVRVDFLGTSVAESLPGVVFWYGVVTGPGPALVVIPYTTPALWSEKRRGVATGLATAGAGVGIMAVPTCVLGLIDVFGWRRAYAGLATVLVELPLFTAVLLGDGPRNRRGMARGANATDPGPPALRSNFRTSQSSSGRSRSCVSCSATSVCTSPVRRPSSPRGVRRDGGRRPPGRRPRRRRVRRDS